MSREVDILLVEDNPGDAKLVEHYLSNPSMDAFLGETTLTQVGSLGAAKSVLDEQHFDVILLDLGLPESEGIETLERATAIEASPPVIVLTGLDDTDVAVDAIQSGAQDYLPKGELDGDRLARSLRYAIERHEHEQALMRRNDQLDFFNSILRHDMMNGLNVIMARAQMLQEDLDDPDGVEYAASIHDWSVKITDLTEKVRSILESVTDDGDASLEPVTLASVVEPEAERVDGLTDRVSIQTDVDPDLRVLANDLLGDVVSNLLTNAVTHTDEAATVEVTATDTGQTAHLRVADDGPGVPADRRDDLFDRGQKGASSTGTGFGLFFVSSMVDSYGGDVWVEQSDRGGAAFVCELPLA